MSKKTALMVPPGTFNFTQNILKELSDEELGTVVYQHGFGFWDREHPDKNIIKWIESQLSGKTFTDLYREFSRSRNDQYFDYLQNYQVLFQYYESVGKKRSCTGRILTTHRFGKFSTVWALTDFCIPDCRDSDPQKHVNGQPQVLTTLLFPSEY